MIVQTNRHIVITDAEQQTIVNALAFYNAHYTFLSDELDKDERTHWRLAFQADNYGTDREGPVDQLATRIANSH